ncbi:MAG: gamma-glutamylcyclotransferase [Burkholderiaceae bacterium]|nr:gamma-glutamylcyclotransferase [Burkholderiaceae bacterium]
MDPFAHLPDLRDRLTPAAESPVRGTPEALARWDERARDQGLPASWRLSDRQLEDTRRALLSRRVPSQDLWVFGYGSLMWDPGIHFAELRRAHLAGWQRRFSYRTILGRGTPERPALTLALEPADGHCSGLAFRIAAADVEVESAMLWRREMLRNGYCPTLLPLATPQGEVIALVFASNPAHHDHVGELPLAEAARIIAGASGAVGSNRDYLAQVAAQLDALGIEDRYITDLLERVRRLAGD